MSRVGAASVTCFAKFSGTCNILDGTGAREPNSSGDVVGNPLGLRWSAEKSLVDPDWSLAVRMWACSLPSLKFRGPTRTRVGLRFNRFM
jgi:hypothetical protein